MAREAAQEYKLKMSKHRHVQLCLSGYRVWPGIIHYHNKAISPQPRPGYTFTSLRFPAGDFILMSINTIRLNFFSSPSSRKWESWGDTAQPSCADRCLYSYEPTEILFRPKYCCAAWHARRKLTSDCQQLQQSSNSETDPERYIPLNCKKKKKNQWRRGCAGERRHAVSRYPAAEGLEGCTGQ